MAVEQKRGCGYRKVGGLYLVGEGIAVACDRLNYNLEVCPTCNQGIKFSMGFTWIDGFHFFGKHMENYCIETDPICTPQENAKYGLMWVGRKFYTPQEFIEEAKRMDVCKRIARVPKGLKIGDFVLLAHKEAGTKLVNGETIPFPAIFYGFHVRKIEKIITESQSKDEKIMNELKEKNINPVIVPNDDKDHKGTVYDKEEK